MNQDEFQRLLLLFPVVRSRDFNLADSESSGQSASVAARNEAKEWQDAWSEQEVKTDDTFWDNLRSAAEKKVGPSDAEKFCNAFHKIYQKLVSEELSKEVMERFLTSS